MSKRPRFPLAGVVLGLALGLPADAAVPGDEASLPAAEAEMPAEPAADPPAGATLLDPPEEDSPLEGDPLFDDEFELATDSASRDPLEPLNRGVFQFNRGVDAVLFDPITRGYQFLVPRPGRQAIHRLFLNLDTPVVLLNQLLQLRVPAAAVTVGRFVINSSVGVGGLFDPAAFGELQRGEADFGQTLARYGTPSGAYLMLPVFGPSTVRDALGDVVDVMVDPVTYILGPLQWWTLALGGGEGLATREAVLAELDALEEGSLDFYAALRSAYLQSRDAAVREVRGQPEPSDLVMSD